MTVAGGASRGCQGGLGTLETVADLADRLRSADERDPLVAAVEEVVDRETAAQHVVDGDRAERLVARRTVHDHDRSPPPGHAGQVLGLRVEGRDEDALHPLLDEVVEVRHLAVGPVAAVAHVEREVALLGRLLDPGGDVGEERVGRVEHHVRQRAAAPRPQVPRSLVAHEAEVGHRLLDPATGRWADPVGPVQHVRHRAERDTRPLGDVLDARHPRPPIRSVAKTLQPACRADNLVQILDGSERRHLRSAYRN